MISKLRLAIRNDLEAGEEARAFGSGWISGVLGLALSGSALLLLLSQQYPAWFSVDELGAVHKGAQVDQRAELPTTPVILRRTDPAAAARLTRCGRWIRGSGPERRRIARHVRPAFPTRPSPANDSG